MTTAKVDSMCPLQCGMEQKDRDQDGEDMAEDALEKCCCQSERSSPH